jgi:ubiquinone/menaquinone biosynthesis C-methylase UbiE
MSYVFMKVLESSPSRYDRGINFITLGRIGKIYEWLASHIESGWRVLDIGCGTGAVAVKAAGKGARVTGIDINPQMLEIARSRIEEANLSGSVELREQGVAELSAEPSARYDAAICSLVFSELTGDERVYMLHELRRLLKPGGLLLVAVETRPHGFFKQVLYWLARIPLAIITYLLTQTGTGDVNNPQEIIGDAGFIMEEVHCNWLGSLTELVFRNPSVSGDKR